jgi:hypothetical protein
MEFVETLRRNHVPDIAGITLPSAIGAERLESFPVMDIIMQYKSRTEKS